MIKVIPSPALVPAAARYLCQTPARSMATDGPASNLPTDKLAQKDDKLSFFKGKKFPDFETAYRRKGPGGRASFNGITATIFNSGSMLSRVVTARLGSVGTQLVLAYRGSRYDSEKLRIAGDLGQIFFAHYHLKDEATLYRAMEHSNVVINMVARETPTRNFSLEEVNVDGARRIARIAREVGVKKLIHISVLNANPDPTPVVLKNGSEFLRTKYYGEMAVREEFPEAIIFRPSDMIGSQDKFINHYCSYLRCLFRKKISLWDYYDGVEKQPVWVNDVVSGIENAIFDDSADGKTIQAVGPYRYDFYELIEFIRSCAGRSQKYDDCRTVNLRYDLPMWIAIWIAENFRKYPEKLLTWERVERDSITDYVDPKLPTLASLGVQLQPLEKIIMTQAHHRPRNFRVEIPYESAVQIDLPKKLNVAA